MYIPDLYRNEDQEAITQFLHENSFGILVNQTNGSLWATHIPLELDTNTDGKQILFGHLAKENPQWKSCTQNEEVLAIFTGPHSYISSSWYDHENVPTWNYIAVHIYGKIKIITGDAVAASLKKLVDKYEQISENPVKVEEFSRRTMLQTNGIVAFEIEITAIQAKKKLSQNRDETNFKNIITALEKTGSPQACSIAQEMKKCQK
ncbi:FMN-binding negative transcriptional regulator [Flavobacterium restrictum]|uniref:FMN-binding negative transcriptional regulator n=1 Tax=Flavobacterium restrictum TaxID=2594428 RepID=A0A553E2C7_9FLAO|nr:FMN-binding negative transcriptional regulator [Flavobacterium restrictum]TRX39189.1 FMN-binding negative transcriptional regulator [Flavobacterium restrictum]